MKVFIAFLVVAFVMGVRARPGRRDRFVVLFGCCLATAFALYSHRFA
jgi:biotin transporter BioY